MKTLFAIALVLLFAALPRKTAAQQPTLSAGDVVRITLAPEGARDTWKPSSKTYVATLVEATPDSISLVLDRQRALTLPISSVSCLQVSAGKRSNVARGALIGGLGLGLIAGMSALATESNCSGPCTLNLFGEEDAESSGTCCFFGSAAAAFVAGFSVIGIPAAVVGALAGALNPSHRWVEVPVGSTAVLRPGLGSAGPGLTLVF